MNQNDINKILLVSAAWPFVVFATTWYGGNAILAQLLAAGAVVQSDKRTRT